MVVHKCYPALLNQRFADEMTYLVTCPPNCEGRTCRPSTAWRAPFAAWPVVL